METSEGEAEARGPVEGVGDAWGLLASRRLQRSLHTASLSSPWTFLQRLWFIATHPNPHIRITFALPIAINIAIAIAIAIPIPVPVLVPFSYSHCHSYSYS